jgi:hypothetical protein
MPERGFFGSGWTNPSGWAAPPGVWEPLESLPEEPFQTAIQDPAQESFQFPFQYPSQDPGQGEGQYAPVDVPENPLQEISDPFEVMNALDQDEGSSWMDHFDPNASLVANVIDIGRGLAEEQGFDLGVFGDLNLNQSLVGNLWNIGKSMSENPETAWDWGGDFPSLFGNANEVAQGVSENLAPETSAPEASAGTTEGDSFSDWLADTITDTWSTAGEIGQYQQMFQPESGISESAAAVTESPVANAVETAAATGADTIAAGIATGAAADVTGIDVLPAVSDLLDLAASLIL